MKRIVYIATMVALLATACQKTDVLNVVEDSIEFDTQVGKLTKADYSEAKFTTLKDQGFRVWTVADFTLGSDTDGAIYRKMSNLSVIYNAGWGYDPSKTTQKYFWPAANNYLYFYTLSARNATWLDGISFDSHFIKEEIKLDDNSPITEVTKLDLPAFPVGAAADDDVMVADHIYQHKGDATNGKVVKPTFRHTMTKVEFNFKQGTYTEGEKNATEASTVILKGIATDNLINKGELDVTYGFSDVNNTKPFVWTPSTVTTDVHAFIGTPTEDLTIVKKTGQVIAKVAATSEVDAPASNALCVIFNETKTECSVYQYSNDAWAVVETHTKSQDGTWSSNPTTSLYETFAGVVLTATEANFVTWYMIPQPITGKNVTINYVADGKHLTQKFALTGTKEADSITWGEEICVKYNVTIAPHKIEFSPSVGEWNPQENANLNN